MTIYYGTCALRTNTHSEYVILTAFALQLQKDRWADRRA